MSREPQPPQIAQAGEPSPVRLSDVPVGELARLHTANLAPPDCALLRALGLTDRCLLRVCTVGQSCIVQVHSTRIGLSRSVADGIFVVPQKVG